MHLGDDGVDLGALLLESLARRGFSGVGTRGDVTAPLSLGRESLRRRNFSRGDGRADHREEPGERITLLVRLHDAAQGGLVAIDAAEQLVDCPPSFDKSMPHDGLAHVPNVASAHPRAVWPGPGVYEHPGGSARGGSEQAGETRRQLR
ncbi:MAG: hypothetical protein J0J04_15870 [Microbacterium sp.]|uniref:hypothetical protein n=1 Tax=Microbacterium sp. TaxID=51671 RepID=UPI001AC075B4|nr:hypothetical protein [Microbacterium sp.]MBN9216253.1 hypothetical protein [Microbacterium sp.]